ncbi:MCE family protein [Nocardioides sp. W3-2-3]|uniref:MlaD family protein n=1 Tax=Nocardioides convexus TaxID=2712224 RepID=UPI002418A284|nr:MlaD family protein [Nocardioides convexus]NHA01245.1 MCE family protein [Nocardioides convexus]
MTAVGALLASLTAGCSLQPNENTLPGQVATGSDGYGVTVHFEAVENLVPNSQVLLDDVVVGTVTDIRVQDWHAVADIRLLDSVPISEDARFTIGQKTLLGAQYVEVNSPRVNATASPASLLADGDEVPLARTGQAPGTEQVLAGVALLLNNGGLSQISTITGESHHCLGRATTGRTRPRRPFQRACWMSSTTPRVRSSGPWNPWSVSAGVWQTTATSSPGPSIRWAPVWRRWKRREHGSSTP